MHAVYGMLDSYILTYVSHSSRNNNRTIWTCKQLKFTNYFCSTKTTKNPEQSYKLLQRNKHSTAKKQAFHRSQKSHRSHVNGNKPLSIFHVIMIINPKQM